MSETSQGYTRFKAAWREADADTRGTILFQLLGLLWMVLSIVWAFGWPGILFCVGFGLWKLTQIDEK